MLTRVFLLLALAGFRASAQSGRRVLVQPRLGSAPLVLDGPASTPPAAMRLP